MDNNARYNMQLQPNNEAPAEATASTGIPRLTMASAKATAPTGISTLAMAPAKATAPTGIPRLTMAPAKATAPNGIPTLTIDPAKATAPTRIPTLTRAPAEAPTGIPTLTRAPAEATAPIGIPTLTRAQPDAQGNALGFTGAVAVAVPFQGGIPTLTAEEECIPPPKPDFSAPPPYEVATKLPSYEEVQREKTLQGETTPHPHPHIHLPGTMRAPHQPLTFLAVDTEAAEGDPESGLLGTDFMFFTAFLVAFLFNWIGFILLMCFCHTIASRYGALSGFGLSLTKWTLIVKHSTDLASRENSWLWWLIMAFGILICVRAIIQYLNIKRGWRLLSGSAQERLLFFY